MLIFCVHKRVRQTNMQQVLNVFFLLSCVQAQVLYDFIAEAGNNELTVKEGETLTVTNQVNLVLMPVVLLVVPVLYT